MEFERTEAGNLTDKGIKQYLRDRTHKLQAENERLKDTIRTAIQFHHKSIAECLAGHKDATAWLESVSDLAENEEHEIFSLWLLRQTLKE